MSAEVKNVSEVVKGTVQDIKRTAQEVADKLKARGDEAKQALGLVDAFGVELGNATAELRALLGVATNNPPLEDTPLEAAIEKKKGWVK